MKPHSPQRPALPARISLVAQTAEALRTGIRSGHWATELPGEHKLCAELQVGRHTLRAALDELQRSGWLKTVTGRQRWINRKRVSATAPPTPEQIVLLAPRASASMDTNELLELAVMRDLLLKAGYDVQTRISGPCFSHQPARALAELTRCHPSALWIVLGSKAPLQQWMIKNGQPCFISGSCDPSLGFPSMDRDHHATCRHAVGVFRRKSHRHLALVLPRDAYGGDLESERGFLEGIQQSGPHIRHTILRHNRTKPHLCALLDTALRAASPPTAFLVTHAVDTITVTTHLMQRGQRIPQDIAVISRDADRALDAMIPAVTHYHLDIERLATRTAHAVRQWMVNGTLTPRAIRLMPEFVKGETV